MLVLSALQAGYGGYSEATGAGVPGHANYSQLASQCGRSLPVPYARMLVALTLCASTGLKARRVWHLSEMLCIVCRDGNDMFAS